MLAALLATSIVAFAGGMPAVAKTSPAQEQRTANAAVPETWTRLHEALARRTLHDGEVVGLDEAELLLWPDSVYLLDERRHAELLSALQAFGAAGPRGPEVDVPRRVLMQQELWAAFDWAFSRSFWPARADQELPRALARELARALALSAPTSAEIAGLASNLAADDAARALPTEPDATDPQRPFLPKGLGLFDGDWVYVRDGRAYGPLARAHSEAIAGRSQFGVAFKLPGGPDATKAWIQSLPSTAVRCDGTSCGPVVGESGRAHDHLDPLLLEMPAGALVALVQRALAFDDRGSLHLTPLVLRIEIRAYFELPEGAVEASRSARPEGWPWQAFAQHALVPSRWLAGQGSCFAAVERGETVYNLVGTHGDPIEHAQPRRPGEPEFGRLDMCVACHGAPGLASVNSYTGIMSGPGTQLDAPLATAPRALVPADAEALAQIAIDFKRSRSDWGALWAWGWGAREER